MRMERHHNGRNATENIAKVESSRHLERWGDAECSLMLQVTCSTPEFRHRVYVIAASVEGIIMTNTRRGQGQAAESLRLDCMEASSNVLSSSFNLIELLETTPSFVYLISRRPPVSRQSYFPPSHIFASHCVFFFCGHQGAPALACAANAVDLSPLVCGQTAMVAIPPLVGFEVIYANLTGMLCPERLSLFCASFHLLVH